MRKCKFFLCLLCFLAFTTGLLAQETTAEISGLVTGDTGPLAGATIKALHQPSGTVYITTSRKDGRYTLPNLRVGGPYSITVTFVGFKSEPVDNVTLLLGQEFKADLQMVPESKSLEAVVVSSVRQDKVFNSELKANAPFICV